MKNLARLDNQFALITGASRGIGRAIAEILAGSGCHVALSSRKLDECRTAAAEISQRHGVQAAGFQADVSRFEDVRVLFEQVHSWSAGSIEILVCNAGYPLQADIWATPLHAVPAGKLTEWYLKVYATDAMGSLYCTREALPRMLARRSGKILYLSSTPALEGFQGTAYTMAKAALLGLMKDVAREYGKDNIRANALALGNIRTPATFDSMDEESRKALAAEAPLKRWGSPEEVGQAALFLVSDQSSFVTGQILVVDGGTVRR
jgi:3-oxoacyl-[acyl-carrier protein] reductase